MATPIRSVHLASVASTMDEARRVFSGDPVLVTTDRQTGGRGRSGRSWVHADRAVAASLAVSPGWPAEQVARITLTAGLCAASTFGTAVKWPNDLVVEAAEGDLVKVGGILVEGPEPVVVGLGVNLHWPSPIEGAGALYEQDPGPAAAREAAERWAACLLDRLAAGPDAWGGDEYERVCVTVGRDVTWEPGGRGRATGIDDDGRLVVETAEGPVTLDSGEVRHVRARR